MAELELVGLDQDGERLVLRGDDGLRFTLPIDEALRAAVRRDRPQLEQVRTEQSGTLTPREIQARIRAGQTAAEIAESADVTVQHVRRFEGPVIDERAYIAEQARTAPVGRDLDAPALGDLVADRLVARGVEIGSLTWDAARDRSGPWVVVARFVAAEEPREARWAFDPSTKTLTATEDEARWLSETEIAEPAARRHLTAVRPVVFDLAQVETPTTSPTPAVDTLLDELGSRRGKRQPVDLDDGPDEAPSTPTPVTKTTRKAKTTTSRPTPKVTTASPPATAPSAASARSSENPDHAGASRRTGSSRTKAGTTSTSTAAGATSATGRGRRKGRAKVPSWDEIVFGAKPE
ncbi:MAG: septation protein SepH [Micrococcales bacterium]|nr:septation protein SepH [Micrococcales bacterium]